MNRMLCVFLLPLFFRALASGQGSSDSDTFRRADANPGIITPIVRNWPECDEFISKSPCKVTVNISNVPISADNKKDDRGPFMPRAHWDVQVPPIKGFKRAIQRGEAAVYLENSSPFMSCTVSATPAAPNRDLSTNIGTLLTSAAGLGAIPSGPVMAMSRVSETEPVSRLDFDAKFNFVLPDAAPALPASEQERRLRAIEQKLRTVQSTEDGVNTQIGETNKKLRKAIQDYWKYTFPDEDTASAAITQLREAINTELQKAPPDSDALVASVKDIATDMAAFTHDYPAPDPALSARVAAAQNNIAGLQRVASLLKEPIAFFADQRKSARQVYDFLINLKDTPPSPLFTEQALPMAYFSGKSSTQTITCKDAISANPAFDNIVFNAYYEKVPAFDISAGVIASLLGGRQVAALSAPFSSAQAQACAGAPTCAPETLLGYKTQSPYQFMPGVFVEWRALNKACPWAHNGQPWHPFGYVCSLGPAGGVAINPNNGGTAGEFYTGLSFGIQRFAIMAGVHIGRYQQFGGGYYLGETFPAGVAVTPPTVLNWSARPAFALAYRIPLR